MNTVIEREKLESKYEDKIQTNFLLNRQIVSYQENKKTPVFDWFPYKEGFSYRLIKYLIEKECKFKPKLILDPFAGSCTSLFVAKDLGIDSVGIELLPIGKFIFLIRKILTRFNQHNELSNIINRIESSEYLNSNYENKYCFKHLRITEKAFPEKSEDQMNKYITYVNNLSVSREIKIILKFACFSVLEKVSYTRKDGQCLRWDKRAFKGKSDFDKGEIPSFHEAIVSKLKKMMFDILNDSDILDLHPKKDIKINLITGSTFEKILEMANNNYDAIITSPPYLNRYDYTRIYALELAFLGIDEDGIRRLRQRLLSSTVESKGKREQLKSLYENKYGNKQFELIDSVFYSLEALSEIIKKLDEYKKDKKLNNNGIVRMVKEYFYEHSFLIFEMYRVLNDGGIVFYVNDNVRYAGEEIPVDLILSEIAEKIGFDVEKIYTLPVGKGNSSQQMGNHGRKVLRKCIYKWSKKHAS